MHVYTLYVDPVKAERYDDGILRARERMQRKQDEKAATHQEKMEEVHVHVCAHMHTCTSVRVCMWMGG